MLGIYDSAAAGDTVYVREINGIRIAILNYTYGTNGMTLPNGSAYTINLLEEAKVRADIAQAKDAADFVIVAPHWGTEYTLKPDASQDKWTQLFYECGVNLVIGTANRMVGAMAQVTISMDAQGKAYILDYGVLPLVTHVRTGAGQITTYKLSDYTQNLAEENEICSSDPDFSLAYCQDLCRQVFGELYN